MSKIVITKKDEEIINTVKNLKVIKSSQLQRLFFSHQQSQSRRCKQLVNHKKIKCYKEGYGSEMIYYCKRRPTQQVKSMLTVSEFYVNLMEIRLQLNFNVVQFTREYSVEVSKDFTIRPDAYFVLEKDGIEFEYFLEVDRAKEFSADKYFKAMKLGYTPPPIISVSNRKRKIYDGMYVIKMKLDLSDFEKVFPSCI